MGGGQNLKRPNVEFETLHIEITKVEFYELSNSKNLLIEHTDRIRASPLETG